MDTTLDDARRVLKITAGYLNRIQEIVGILADAQFNVETVTILNGGDQNNKQVVEHTGRLEKVQAQLAAAEQCTVMQAGVRNMDELYMRYETILAAANYVEALNQAYIAIQLRKSVLEKSGTGTAEELSKLQSDLEKAEKELPAALSILSEKVNPFANVGLAD